MDFLEDKIEEINKTFREILPGKKVLIRGAGAHTKKLFEYSNLLQFSNSIIADRYSYGRKFFGKNIVNMQEVDMNAIDVAVISSLQYQNEMENELLNKYKFRGKIVKIYAENEKNEFYRLQSKNESQCVYEGDFKSWKDAEDNSSGYGEKNILEKVKESTLAVLSGKAVYERDSALFKDKKISFHLMAYIAKLGLSRERIVIVDFGGALGSTYLQNREFLKSLPVDIEYNIVEQQSFVNEGKKLFKEDNLVNFVYSLDEIQENIDLILFSGVLQCVEEYEKIILKVLERRIEYVIIDRTPISKRERICIQKVPDSIYEASFPIRIFKKERLLALFTGQYDLGYEFHSFVDEDIYFRDGTVEYKGFVFRKK